jgi:NAD(P)-dependent dehydrogenase (short-subunit alcohol dehydrogenase family)
MSLYLHNVIIIQALAAKLKGVKGEIHAVQGDVRQEEDVVRVVKWTRDNLGGADVLVNNAGVSNYMPLTGYSNIYFYMINRIFSQYKFFILPLQM